MFLWPLLCQLKGKFQKAVNTFAGKNTLLHRDFTVCPRKNSPSNTGVLALAVLPHYIKIDLARLAIGQWRGNAMKEPHGAQIHILVELPPEFYYRSPE